MPHHTPTRARAVGVLGPGKMQALDEAGLVVVDAAEWQKWRKVVILARAYRNAVLSLDGISEAERELFRAVEGL
jgi:hypothetical protein